MTSPRRAVVTGAAGFIGARLATRLESQGASVARIGRGCALARIDGESLRAAGDADTYFHCAGGASVGDSIADPVSDFHDNVTPLVEVLDYVRRAQPGAAVVVVSTAAVYGAVPVLPISEDAPLHPVSPYGLHKLLAEQLCQFHGAMRGLRIAVVRLFSVYGPELRKQLLWDAANKARAGDLVFGGTGEELRDWLHVDDACALLLAAAAAAAPSVPIVNGGTGNGVAVRTVLALLLRELSVPNAPRFSGVARPGDPRGYVADPRQAIMLGWKPERSLDQGIAEYARWFRELARE